MNTHFVQFKQRLSMLVEMLLPTKRHRWIMASFFVVMIIVGSLIFVDTTHAFNCGDGTDQNCGLVRLFLRMIMELMLALTRLFLAMTAFFLQFFIQLAAYNDYLNADIVRLGWTMVRDLANMFFVVILLVIAFATILGKENYEWKKTLVKLVLAAVFINFSLLIAGLAIDAAHVFTITFLNAIAPASGENLIGMLNLGEMQRIVTDRNQEAVSGGSNLNITIELFGGIVLALVFASMAMVIMAVYAMILLIRMVYLWILLILSPLAFIFSILPATKAQAQEWIGDFTKYVLVAPVMVFFLWLAFAAFGAPGSAANMINESNFGGAQPLVSDPAVASATGQAASINAATTWHNMASFLIAVGFLFAGVDRVQKMNVKGGGALSAAGRFAKNVVTIAAGVRLAQWGARKTKDAAKFGAGATWSGVKKAYDIAPIIGGRAMKAKAENYKSAFYGYLMGKGLAMQPGAEKHQEKLERETRVLNATTEEGAQELDAVIQKLESGKRQIQSEMAAEQQKLDEAARVGNVADVDKHKAEIEKHQTRLEEVEGDIDFNVAIKQDASKVVTKGDKNALLAKIDNLEVKARGESAGGLIGWAVRKDLEYQKTAGKSKKQAENRRDLLWKRTGSQAGGKGLGVDWIIPGPIKRAILRAKVPWLKDGDGQAKTVGQTKIGNWAFGKPHNLLTVGLGTDGLLGTRWMGKLGRVSRFLGFREGGGIFADPLAKDKGGPEAQDRIERGWLQAEEMRSRAKDHEFESKGRYQVLKAPRIKYNVDTGILGYEVAKGTMAERIENREIKGETYDEMISLLKTRARDKEIDKVRKVEAEIMSSPDLKKVQEAMNSLGGRLTNLGDRMRALSGLEQARSEQASFDVQEYRDELYQNLLRQHGVQHGTAEAQPLYQEADAKARRREQGLARSVSRALRDTNAKLLRTAASSEVEKLKEFDANVAKRQREIWKREGITASSDQQIKNAAQSRALEAFGGQAARRKLEEAVRDAQADAVSNGLAFGTTAPASVTKQDIDSIIDKLREDQLDTNERLGDQRDKRRALYDTEVTKRKAKKMPAWALAEQKAKREHEELFYRGREQKLLDDAAQRYVWDTYGITSPNNAFEDVVDKLLSSFREMNYENAVAANDNFIKYVNEKRSQGEEISFSDDAISMVLLKKMQNNSWNDDLINGNAAYAHARGDANASKRGFENKRKLSRTELNSIGQVLRDVIGDRTEAQNLLRDLQRGGASAEAALARALEQAEHRWGGIASEHRRNIGIGNTAPRDAGRALQRQVRQANANGSLADIINAI